VCAYVGASEAQHEQTRDVNSLIVVKLPKDNACNLSLDASMYTHGDGGHTATPNEATDMYTLQYRFREVNGRYTKWYNVSTHDHKDDATGALAQHIVEFSTFNARVVTEQGREIGHYKYSRPAPISL